jgi:hypothetical protein
MFQDGYSKKSIQDIQARDQEQATQQFRAVAVNIAASALIFCSAE